jgi:hypothetical protein
MRIDITVRGERAQRWEDVVDAIEDDLGYRPSRPEALGLLMAEWDDDLNGVL